MNPPVPNSTRPSAENGWLERVASDRHVRLAFVLVSILLSLYFGWRSITENSVTFDEYAHLPAGLVYWQTGDFTTYGQNPPLTRMFQTLPLVLMGFRVEVPPPMMNMPRNWLDVGEIFMKAEALRYHRIFTVGRMMNLFWLPVLALCLAVWAMRLGGPLAGGMALWFTLFAPNLLANATLVSPDFGVAAAAMLWIWSYARWRVCSDRAMWRAAGWGAALGVALLCKFTTILLLPAPIMILLMERERRTGQWGQLLLAYMVGWLVFCAGYGFHEWWRPVGSLNLESGKFAILPDWLPLPIPAEALIGLDNEMATIAAENPRYLFAGRFLPGWLPLYPWLALVAKLAAPLLLAFGFAAIRGRKAWRNREVRIAALFAAWFLMMVTMVAHRTIGVRFYLILWPPLILLAATGLAHAARRTRARIVAVALTLAMPVVAAIQSPYFLTYYSALVGGKRYGTSLVADSNLDMGQGLIALRDWMDEHHVERLAMLYGSTVHPRVYGIRYELPTEDQQAEWTAISANAWLYDKLDKPTFKYRVPWLRHREPDVVVGDVMLLFGPETDTSE